MVSTLVQRAAARPRIILPELPLAGAESISGSRTRTGNDSVSLTGAVGDLRMVSAIWQRLERVMAAKMKILLAGITDGPFAGALRQLLKC
jgi:hypothetical protein